MIFAFFEWRIFVVILCELIYDLQFEERGIYKRISCILGEINKGGLINRRFQNVGI